jgi:ABC-type lipoprotein export system ATPase subunit
MALIELDHIVKTYDLGAEKVHALRDIHFGIERGEFVAIVGQSGSGKSTLMNIVGCLDVPTSGTYRLSSFCPAPARSRTWSCRSSTAASPPASGGPARCSPWNACSSRIG